MTITGMVIRPMVVVFEPKGSRDSIALFVKIGIVVDSIVIFLLFLVLSPKEIKIKREEKSNLHLKAMEVSEV